MLKEHSALNLENIPDGTPYKIAVITAEWNSEITSSLKEHCVETLRGYGVLPVNIIEVSIPGTFELPTAASVFAAREDISAVVCLGCVIQGETRHFEFICNAVANGLTRVGIEVRKPVIFGVITANTIEQAQARSGDDHNNKGREAAVSALKMLGVLER
jgi:6,7-dimethyl-8-ribityllumazine synthase